MKKHQPSDPPAPPVTTNTIAQQDASSSFLEKITEGALDIPIPEVKVFYAGSLEQLRIALTKDTTNFVEVRGEDPYKTMMGLNIYEDANLPDDAVELRDGEGKVLGRYYLKKQEEGDVADVKY